MGYVATYFAVFWVPISLATLGQTGRLTLAGTLSKEEFPFTGPGQNLGGVNVKKIQGPSPKYPCSVHILPWASTRLEQNKAALLL